MPALGTITNVGVSGVVSVEKLDEVSSLFLASRAVERLADLSLRLQTLQKVVQACGQIHGVAKGALAVELA
jgi:hypothetical protein